MSYRIQSLPKIRAASEALGMILMCLQELKLDKIAYYASEIGDADDGNGSLCIIVMEEGSSD